MTVRVAKNLQRFGCDRGKRILIFVGNTSEIVPVIYGALCLGCPLVTIFTSSTQAECEYFLRLTKPEFVICHRNSYEMLKSCFVNLKTNVKFFTADGCDGAYADDDPIPIQSLFEEVEDDSHFE